VDTVTREDQARARGRSWRKPDSSESESDRISEQGNCVPPLPASVGDPNSWGWAGLGWGVGAQSPPLPRSLPWEPPFHQGVLATEQLHGQMGQCPRHTPGTEEEHSQCRYTGG
jgi:hypothetical protein